MKAPEGERRLVAILAADVSGYSRLMAAQEEATVRALKSHRPCIDELIAKHHGRIVGTAGDSVLAEFFSPIAAVQCAIEIQEEIRRRNVGVLPHRVMEFRIGINLGDIIVDGPTIYGDAVNIAARLEGLADSGGIMVAGSVFDQVYSKVDCLFVNEGPKRVKNIPERVRVYSIVAKESEASFRRAVRTRRIAIGGGVSAAAVAVVLVAAWQLGAFKPHRPASLPVVPEANVIRDCPECPELVALPVGSYRRGTAPGEQGYDATEGPAVIVQITKLYAIGRYEVTFAQWDACVVEKGCSFAPTDRGWGRGNRPVFYVSWNDVQEYVKWLSAKSGKRYRLPSEAEWEYAARGGNTSVYPWGDEAGSGRANCLGCGEFASNQTVPVGSFPPNRFGLFDMIGNVWEWASDCWNGSYAGAPTDGSAWLVGECDKRVVRGGAWGLAPAENRVAKREGDKVELRSGRRGFRVARDLP